MVNNNKQTDLKIEKIAGKVNIFGLTEQQIFYLTEKSYESIKRWKDSDSMFETHPLFPLLLELVKYVNPIKYDTLISNIKEFLEFVDE
jgi:hypothetical protein